MKYEKLDWDKINWSPERKAWLRDNFNKDISLEMFTEEMIKLKGYSKSEKKPSRVYSPSALRMTYKKLKERFGFFTGNL